MNFIDRIIWKVFMYRFKSRLKVFVNVDTISEIHLARVMDSTVAIEFLKKDGREKILRKIEEDGMIKEELYHNLDNSSVSVRQKLYCIKI